MSQSDNLYVDHDEYTEIMGQVNRIRSLLSPLTAMISQKEGTSVDDLCDSTIAQSVAQFQSAWSQENALNVNVLNEINRKMSATLKRYQATDGTSAHEIKGLTVQQAGKLT